MFNIVDDTYLYFMCYANYMMRYRANRTLFKNGYGGALVLENWKALFMSCEWRDV